jgi:serine kinase of HPr protein (carbohydrate metabolism regulator)
LQQIHGTAVAVAGQGLLILGPSGSGKSSLALDMMASGAALLADDRTDLRAEGNEIIMSCPAPLQGMIEAWGVGLLRAKAWGPAPLRLVVDLGQTEVARLPPHRVIHLLGKALPLVLGPYRPHLCSALRQYLLQGRKD